MFKLFSKPKPYAPNPEHLKKTFGELSSHKNLSSDPGSLATPLIKFVDFPKIALFNNKQD